VDADEEIVIASPSQEDLDLIDHVRSLNPKKFSTSGAGSIKCATDDCNFKAAPESIFCMACDNERNRPMWAPVIQLVDTRTMADPAAETFQRRKALSDHRRGITKATL
jgi:hypothetical protein